jgi:nicotinamide phosphoribosyltransferase
MWFMTPTVYKDFYKTDHRPQYPLNTWRVYSNLTPRESRIPGINQIVVFGIQYFVKEYLIRAYNERFFSLPKEEAVRRYKRRLDHSLGKDTVSMKHIEELHDLGYLPLHIKALPEGSLSPLRVPVLTITNTDKRFFWLTNDQETILSTTLWGMMTSATIAYEYRTILEQYGKSTSDQDWFIDWQAHDFSMRGMFGCEAACMSGAAHLISFTGTDTIPAIDFLEHYYGADCEKEMIGGSVPATEHSVMCMGGEETEVETYRRLLVDVYPKGIVSIVSDTWDFWKVLTEEIPKLKDIIMKRDGKLVIRPDSGDPIKILCGDPNSDDPAVVKGAVEVLWDLFGGEINSKGYKQLDPHIGLIYGDSITIDRCRTICRRLKQKGFSTTNVVYGVGSYTYQHVTRDTFGFAVKSTYGVIDGKPVDIFKKPKTDNGIKNSAKGLLMVDDKFNLVQCCTPEQENSGMLQTVFLNGKLENETTLAQIRSRLKTQRKMFYPEPGVSE